MNISKNKTYHEKVYDLTSPTIPHFQLSLKNSQSYDHFKKSSKRCGVFFVPNCTFSRYVLFFDIFIFCGVFDVFVKIVLYLSKKITTLRFVKYAKKFFLKTSTKVNIFTKKNFSNQFCCVCDLIIGNEIRFLYVEILFICQIFITKKS